MLLSQSVRGRKEELSDISTASTSSSMMTRRLPGLVFVNGQVLLDKITSHQLRENPSCGVAIRGEWESAIVTQQQLEGFGRHYQEGLFSVDHLIKLFTFKPILAPIGQDRFLFPAEDQEKLTSFVRERRAYFLFNFIWSVLCPQCQCHQPLRLESAGVASPGQSQLHQLHSA